MKTWFGLLVAPTLVLVAQSVNYALVPIACAAHTVAPLGIVSALSFAVSLLATVLAYREWRASAAQFPAGYDARSARAPCLAFAATILGALAALIQLTMWFPQWLLSPCR